MRAADPKKTHRPNDLCTMGQAHQLALRAIATTVGPDLERLLADLERRETPWVVRVWRRLRGR